MEGRGGGWNAGCGCRPSRGSDLAPVLSPGRAQWRLLCVRAQAGGGGVGGARAVADTRTRESRLTSDPWVVEVYVARMETFSSQGLRPSIRAQPGFLCWRPGGVCVCVCARTEECGPGMWEGAARGAACARGNGGGLLCVVLGGAAAR